MISCWFPNFAFYIETSQAPSIRRLSKVIPDSYFCFNFPETLQEGSALYAVDRTQALARGTGNVTGEYRGSITIERFIDPADARLGGEIDPDTQSLEPLYRFRVIENKRFAP